MTLVCLTVFALAVPAASASSDPGMTPGGSEGASDDNGAQQESQQQQQQQQQETPEEDDRWDGVTPAFPSVGQEVLNDPADERAEGGAPAAGDDPGEGLPDDREGGDGSEGGEGSEGAVPPEPPIPIPPGMPDPPTPAPTPGEEGWVGPLPNAPRRAGPVEPEATGPAAPEDPGPSTQSSDRHHGADGADRADVIAVWAPVAAGAGLGALGLGALFARYGGALMLALHLLLQRCGLPLGYRIEGDAVRDHPVRARILEHVGRHPGSTLADLNRATEGSYGACTHHVRILLRAGFLRMNRNGDARRYFLASTPKVAEEVVRARDVAHPHKTSGKLLAHLAMHNGQPTSHAAYALGISLGQVSFHLGNLRRHGLVRSVRKGRRVRNYVTELGRLALDAAANGISSEHYQVEAAALTLRTPRLSDTGGAATGSV